MLIWLYAQNISYLDFCGDFGVERRSARGSKTACDSFGKWTLTKWYVGPRAKAIDVKIRALCVGTRLKKYTTGPSHGVTDRLFVVRRMFRLSDTLPSETTAATKGTWERGGWLLVDRVTGRVTQITLPEFDPFYLTPSWYRDYIAYGGVSDDGKKLFAILAQLGRRKPILKKALGEAEGDDLPDSECSAPIWQRQPAKVTFESEQNQKLTFSVRGTAVDLVNDAEEDDQGAE
jgi:hypothetical protein